MKFYSIFLSVAVAATMALTGCSPKMSTKIVYKAPVIVTSDDVVVYSPYVDAPADAVVIGTVSVRDTGFSGNHQYSEVIEMIKEIAADNGGNAVKVTRRSKPQALSHVTYNVDATILRIDTPVSDGSEDSAQPSK